MGDRLVARGGGSLRDAVNWLFIVSAATSALGLTVVLPGLVPPADDQVIPHLLMPRPRSRDTTAVDRPIDHIGAGWDRGAHARAARSRLHASSQRGQPAAFSPVYGTNQESDQPDDDVDPRTDLLDSASAAHGYLVPRPSTDQVD
jgi:hypothetical protein